MIVCSAGHICASNLKMSRLNLDSPRYDQSTFEGRAKHFFATTNPLNILASDAELEKAKEIVTAYKAGQDGNWTEDEIWVSEKLLTNTNMCFFKYVCQL